MNVQLITLDPGHFHAALVQKEMYGGVDPRVHVYAPLAPDLLAHLQRIIGFNTRPTEPTDWRLEVHAASDFLDRFLAEKPGNVVILSGRNGKKIDYLEAAVGAGLNVLADKPWIIRAEDLPRLQNVLDTAESKGLIALDIMTERYEITSILQRILVNDADVFGTAEPGTAEEPGVYMESVHYLMKQVAGVPLRRPAWFFDVNQQGEGLSDVGTHLVDLVQWMLFPGKAIEDTDLNLLAARRWPTVLSREDFSRVTGEPDFPDFLRQQTTADGLPYFCNTQVGYTLRGVHVKMDVLWAYEAEKGTGDSHFAVFRGTRSRVEIRQGAEQNFRPEVYVVPNRPEDGADVLAALEKKLAGLQKVYAGTAVQQRENDLWVTIPDEYRVGHEAHFGEVTRKFLEYLARPELLPKWEKPGMMAKYRVTTEGVRLAQTS